MSVAARKITPRSGDGELKTAVQALTDGVAKLNENVDGLTKDVGAIKTEVTIIGARNYDGQIAKLENHVNEQVRVLHDSNKSRDERIRQAENLLARFGGYLAVAGAIGGAALGVMATKVFG